MLINKNPYRCAANEYTCWCYRSRTWCGPAGSITWFSTSL